MNALLRIDRYWKEVLPLISYQERYKGSVYLYNNIIFLIIVIVCPFLSGAPCPNELQKTSPQIKSMLSALQLNGGQNHFKLLGKCLRKQKQSKNIFNEAGCCLKNHF